VTKPTRTGDGKAQGGQASIGGGLAARWSNRRK
jgi:hypothetical protein